MLNPLMNCGGILSPVELVKTRSRFSPGRLATSASQGGREVMMTPCGYLRVHCASACRLLRRKSSFVPDDTSIESPITTAPID